MIDLTEVARNVVRIPVAGPSPNNTLVFVRGNGVQPVPAPAQGADNVSNWTHIGTTVYQIAGFDQTKAQEYLANTKFSVTGFLRFLTQNDDQDFVIGLDAVEGRLSSDGTLYMIATVGVQVENSMEFNLSFSAYILTKEPQEDFTRPPSPFSPHKTVKLHGSLTGVGVHSKLASKDSITLEPTRGRDAVTVRPFTKEEEAQLLSPFDKRRVIDDDCC
jgi:hypothetical protein